MDKATMDALRKPFPKEQIGKLPRAGIKLDYVGHAAVTDRLNQATGGEWTYTIDKLFDHKNDTYVEGTMMIAGVSRVEYGDGKNPKEAVSNFIRRAAMRFGVALDLWSKEELESSPAQSASPETATTTAASTARSERAPVAGDTSADGEAAANEGEPGSATGSPSPHPDQPHEWKQSPKLSKYEICGLPDCYASRKKGEAA